MLVYMVSILMLVVLFHLSNQYDLIHRKKTNEVK